MVDIVTTRQGAEEALRLFWFRCPKCNSLGRIDAAQLEGAVSIICTECQWHGYVAEGTIVF